MKKFYALLILFAVTVVNANAQVKSSLYNVKPVELNKLMVGKTLGKDFEVTAIKAKPESNRNVKKVGEEFEWEPFQTGTGIYHRDEYPLRQGEPDPYDYKCNVYQAAQGLGDTAVYKIEKFWRYATIDSISGDTLRKYADLIFKVDLDNQIYIPVTDLNVFLTVTNTKTGEQFDVECYCEDYISYKGPEYEKYRSYYPNIADTEFGMFDFQNIIYFCDMGGFGVAHESFTLEGKQIWTEWEPYGTANYFNGLGLWAEPEEEGGEITEDDCWAWDIPVYRKIYNPNPSIWQLWFKGWGAGYVSRFGVDMYYDVDVEAGTLTCAMQEVGDTYELDGEEIPMVVVTLPEFNADVFPAETCGSLYTYSGEGEGVSTLVDEAHIYPFYAVCIDATTGNYNGWIAIDTEVEPYSRENLDWEDYFELTHDEETAIQKVENKDDFKARATAAKFNLAGMKVNNAYKGLVIKNGKKYLVK